MTTHPLHRPGATRVLLLTDQPLLARLIQLTLSHGPFTTQNVPTPPAARTILATWRPHLVLLDMDLVNGAFLADLADAAPPAERLPVIALTRRGDLATKLAAFEHGADDILTVPFAPEELVARLLAVMRRTYRVALPFTPVLRVGGSPDLDNALCQ